MDNGDVLRVKGQGDMALVAEGPRGDIYFIIRVNQHPYLHRRGADLFSRLPICFTDAILGAHVKVPTLWGVRVLHVPAGTQHEALLPLHGAGLKRKGHWSREHECTNGMRTEKESNGGEDAATEHTTHEAVLLKSAEVSALQGSGEAGERGVHYFQVIVKVPSSQRLSAGALAGLEDLRTLLRQQAFEV